jgi:hypothetical protein
MVVKSKYRGNEIEFNSKGWVFSDTKILVSDNKSRECGNCGLEQTKEGHDACLGELPHLMNACCGHGNNKDAYIQLMNGSSIHGEDAILLIEIFKQFNYLEKTLKEMNIGQLGMIGVESASAGARLAMELIEKGERGIIIVAAGNVGKTTMSNPDSLMRAKEESIELIKKMDYTPIIKEIKPHNNRNIKRNNRKSTW